MTTRNLDRRARTVPPPKRPSKTSPKDTRRWATSWIARGRTRIDRGLREPTSTNFGRRPMGDVADRSRQNTHRPRAAGAHVNKLWKKTNGRRRGSLAAEHASTAGCGSPRQQTFGKKPNWRWRASRYCVHSVERCALAWGTSGFRRNVPTDSVIRQDPRFPTDSADAGSNSISREHPRRLFPKNAPASCKPRNADWLTAREVVALLISPHCRGFRVPVPAKPATALQKQPKSDLENAVFERCRAQR
jgi:hypothetical protein